MAMKAGKLVVVRFENGRYGLLITSGNESDHLIDHSGREYPTPEAAMAAGPAEIERVEALAKSRGITVTAVAYQLAEETKHGPS